MHYFREQPPLQLTSKSAEGSDELDDALALLWLEVGFRQHS